MKNTQKVWQRSLCVIAIITIISFAAVSCGDGSDNGSPSGGTPEVPGGESQTYTVTFNSNGGSTVSAYTAVTSGAKITAPTPPTRAFTLTEPGLYFGDMPTHYTFVEWRNGATAWDFASSTVTGPITLTAHWTSNRIESVAANDIAAAFTRFVLTGAANDGKYTLAINQDVTLAARASTVTSALLNRELTIIGIGQGQERIITAPVGGAFYVAATYSNTNGGVSLILGENITIEGVDGMTTHLIAVGTRGNLIMKAGSKITGHSSTGQYYPVNLTGSANEGNLATFTMDGGEISGNTVTYASTSNMNGCAAVFVGAHSTFTMNGGEITNNVFTTGSTSGSTYGAGVSSGSAQRINFFMNGGTIIGNLRNEEPADVRMLNYNYGQASGVTFTYTGGTIGALFDGNTTSVSKP